MINMRTFWDNKVLQSPVIDTIRHTLRLYGGYVLVQEHMQAKLELYHKAGCKRVAVLGLWLKDNDSRIFGYFTGKHAYEYTAAQIAFEHAGFSFCKVAPNPVECLKEIAYEDYKIIPFGSV